MQIFETGVYPPKEPPLRIALVEAEGRGWEREKAIDPETVDPRTRLISLRYRTTEALCLLEQADYPADCAHQGAQATKQL